MEKKIIGIDLGGTSIKFAIISLEGEVQQKWSIPTNILDEGSHIVDDIIDSIRHRLDLLGLTNENFAGIGMGSPGVVDREKGTVIGAYNLNWKTLQPLKEKIEEALEIPFFIDNDANVAALGEKWMGAGGDQPDVTFFTLGTGVGGGIIVDGKIIAGANGAGGELGHIHMDDEETECCGCGRKGCLEQYASATGIVRVAGRMLAASEEDSTLRGLQNITAKDVLDAFKEGDALAVRTMEYVGDLLGGALAGFAAVVDPEAIVIGGGVSKAGQPLIDCIQKYYMKTSH